MRLLLIYIFLPAICFSQSSIVWDSPMQVAESSFSNQHPRVVLDRNNNPLILWGNTNEAAAYFARWNGTEFTTPIRVTPMDMEIFTASWAGPDIAAFGDTIYVVCKENPEDMAPAYCIHSYDGGMTFSAPVEVDGMIGDNISRFPAVTVNEDGQPIVAFMKLDSDFGNARYVVATSNDFGNSFNMDVLASEFSGGDVCDCCPVGITSENNYVATLYRDNLDNLRNSWAGISTNGGDMFMNGIQIDQTDWIINACPSSGPDGIIINDSLYSVYMSAASGDSRIYFSTSSLISFEANFDIRLTAEFPELTTQNYPRIANFGNAVAITWRQNVGTNSEIPLLFTSDISNGLPLEYDTVALLDFYGLENTDVAASATSVHVVWQDNYNDVVYYRNGTYAEPLTTSEIIDQQIKLYPNPAKDVIYVKSDFDISTFSLINMNGERIIITSTLLKDEIAINVKNVASGIYLVLLQDNSGVQYISKIAINMP
ncbi:MAG: T9SS type A sorting domain-containing protein [Bacteroidetes bacterium]|nr:T9SS type A sorting domain-containing protein [Bacteroidota bacterium]